jgi:hypothetical protein
MKARYASLALALGAWCSVAVSSVYGATVHGTVKNGTTGKPAGDVEVILIQLQGGMQPVLNSKSDSAGNFTFDYPAIGTQPMLVRAVYRGINFHQPLPPGRNDVEVEVFEPSRDPKTISVGTHFVIFQPNGSSLTVGEEYSITNNSQPAQAYFRADGNFDFALPQGASLKQVAALGPSGMPVVQAALDKGKDRYSVAFAFRPGENGVRLSYELPYPGNAASVKLPTTYAGARLVIVAPPSVQITADGLQPSGQEQGMNLYSRDNLAANSITTVSVSGTAPPPSAADAEGDGGAPQGRDAQQGGGGSNVTVQTIPGRLDDLKWPLVGGFLVVFVVLAFMLSRRTVVAVAGGPPEKSAALPLAKSAKAAAAATSVKSTQTSPDLAEVDAEVSTSLDSLKDTLFRLELRRQAGTISEEDYNRERARAEKVLRDLVRG